MDSLKYNNYAMEDMKPVFTTANETTVTSTTDSFVTAAGDRSLVNGGEGVFSPLAPSFQSRGSTNGYNLLTHQEPKTADSDLTTTDIQEMFLNYQLNNNYNMFEENVHNTDSFLGGSTRPESVASSNMWSDSSVGVQVNRNGELIDNFDFLIKSLSSANNYVSMLTREQLSVLRNIRPNLLYELLLDVAKVRSDKRMRRALPNECAFCKNNGENEECYSQHALKDWRGRVLCPVLRAFRCPRCGATGDRAHTIKYCPENVEGDRLNGVGGRRRMPPSSLVLGSPLISQPSVTVPATPASTPTSAGLKPTPWWCNYD